MTMVLGIMFREADLPWLKLHLPVYRWAFPYILAASDEDNGEATQYLRDCGAEVIHIPFAEHWGNFWNKLIEVAEQRNFQTMMRLDPDEAIFGADVPKIEKILEDHDLVCFTRVNFFFDRLHYNIGTFPDLQGRAWRLDYHPRYSGQRHEGVTNYKSMGTSQDVRIYHYGDCSRTSMNARALKYFNAAQRDAGLPMIESLPPDTPPGARPFPQPSAATEFYIGAQPIDPYEVGMHAPFEE